MSAVITLAAGLVAGVVLGLVFFGGLWWTTQRLATSSRPAILVSVSLLVRVAVLAAGLFLLAQVGSGALLLGRARVARHRIGLTRLAVHGRLPQPTTSEPTTRGGGDMGGGDITPTRQCCGTADSSTST
jgi:F1F0 ATPase subunit 2